MTNTTSRPSACSSTSPARSLYSAALNGFVLLLLGSAGYFGWVDVSADPSSKALYTALLAGFMFILVTDLYLYVSRRRAMRQRPVTRPERMARNQPAGIGYQRDKRQSDEVFP